MTKKRICSVDNCGRSAPYKLYCTRHYWQVKNHGKILPEVKKFKNCQVAGCESKADRVTKGLCEKHYMRLRRNGQFESVAVRVPKQTCIADNCKNKAFYSTGECRNCYLRRKRNGDYVRRVSELSPAWLSEDEVTYSAIHQRLRVRRGAAKDSRCVDCGGQARQWSYMHDCPGERIGIAHDGQTPAPFCPHLEHYDPRCVSCHKAYDLDRYPVNERPYVLERST